MASAYFFVTDQSLFYMAPDLFTSIGKSGWFKVLIASISLVSGFCLALALYRKKSHSKERGMIMWIPILQLIGSMPLFILFFYWGVLI
jgi:ABC-type sugar transport system permease subunit